MRHLQVLETPGRFRNISRTQVLFEQQYNLLHQVFDGTYPAAHAPDIVQADQAVLHGQQGVGPAQGILGLGFGNAALS